jgi:hypothetical protein
MKAFYSSPQRFNNQIIKRWNKRGFKFNAGHLNVLKYSWKTLLFWSLLNRKKLSQVNKYKVNHISQLKLILK